MGPVSLGVSEVEMAELVRLARWRRVLEIGTWKGASALAMAATALSVLTVDHHRGDQHTGPADTLPEAIENIRRSPYSAKVSAVVGVSWEVMPQLKAQGFGLIFVDGAHSYAGAFLDFREARRLVESGGYIAGHDWTLFGVTPAATEVLGRPHHVTERLAVWKWPS